MVERDTPLSLATSSSVIADSYFGSAPNLIQKKADPNNNLCISVKNTLTVLGALP
jgi:hypothetical protein